MSVARDARLVHLYALSFVQEVPTDGDDRVTDVNGTTHQGALAVESDEPDRPVRYG